MVIFLKFIIYINWVYYYYKETKNSIIHASLIDLLTKLIFHEKDVTFFCFLFLASDNKNTKVSLIFINDMRIKVEEVAFKKEALGKKKDKKTQKKILFIFVYF